jgi:hypothetical protein
LKSELKSDFFDVSIGIKTCDHYYCLQPPLLVVDTTTTYDCYYYL